ncbi:hypothetical protein Bbelb_350960 [Branchiostoma belcheri]|nr:hypothetical protein Bbelb_350960 [Branchiostoma belcheri]
MQEGREAIGVRRKVRPERRRGFDVVRATGDSSKVHVIIQGQPIAECPRVLEARGVHRAPSPTEPVAQSPKSGFLGVFPSQWTDISRDYVYARAAISDSRNHEPSSGKDHVYAIEQLKQGLKLLGLGEALEAESHLIAALLCKSTEEVTADSIAEMLIVKWLSDGLHFKFGSHHMCDLFCQHSTAVCFVYLSSSQIMSKTNRQAKQTKPFRTESGAGSTPKSARPTTPDFEVLAVAMKDKPGDDGHLSHASFKQQALKWGKFFRQHVTPYIHAMVYHLTYFLEKYRYLNDLSCESVEQDNGSVDQETARSNKRPAFLVVKQMQKDVQVYVVIHGKPLTRTTSLVEGFVSLMGALYLFQLTYLKDTRLPATHMMEEEGNFKHHLKPPIQSSSHYHEMGLKSESVQHVARNCADHHKTMEMIQIAIKGSTDEMLVPYVREKLESLHEYLPGFTKCGSSAAMFDLFHGDVLDIAVSVRAGEDKSKLMKLQSTLCNGQYGQNVQILLARPKSGNRAKGLVTVKKVSSNRIVSQFTFQECQERKEDQKVSRAMMEPGPVGLVADMQVFFEKVIAGVSHKWEDLARKLGFSEKQIDGIHSSKIDQDRRCREMLRRWRKMKGMEATLKLLKQALIDIDERLTAESL